MKLSKAFQIQPGDVVSFVGGGGKTSTLFRLASELADAGLRVITTTTTHVSLHEARRAFCFVLGRDVCAIQGKLAELKEQISAYRHVMVLGSDAPDPIRARGVTLEEVTAILDSTGVDTLLIEADGARMLPFKAPADHEPVVPPETTLLVPVVGIDVLGKPLTHEYVQRPEIVSRLTGRPLGTEVTPALVAAVLTHRQGGLKGVPPSARVVPLINKIDPSKTVNGRSAMASARLLADYLLACPEVDTVVLGANFFSDRPDNPVSDTSEEPVLEVRTRVAAVILAAGAATRYGQLKQLLPWDDGSLLTHVVDTALQSVAQQVIVVLGNQAETCREALGDRPVTVVVNEEWAQGQGTSVRAGLSALDDNVRAAVFPLADQPLVTVDTIDQILQRYWCTLAPIVWPEYAGKRGNPVLFDRALFSDLLRLNQDAGGRSLFTAYADRAERLPVADAGVLVDIDTPQDYRDYRQPTSGSSNP